MATSKRLTKTISSDEYLESFIFLSSIMIVFLLFSLAMFFVANISGITNILGYLLYFLFTLVITLICFFVILFLTTIYVYKTKHLNGALLFLSRMELYFLLPFLIDCSGFFKNHRDNIKIFYINFNNIIIQSIKEELNPMDVLVLLPHCLQHSSCSSKITSNISNCVKCMKCNIGPIRNISEKYGITAIEVASGGTAARSLIVKYKPKLIIAVACERDLVSGIADVKNIPVIGVLNQRPNGPCIDTSIDLSEFSKVLDDIMDQKLPNSSLG